LRNRHLLLLPTTVEPGEVGALLRARVPGAALERHGEARFGRASRIHGPFALSMEDAVDAGVPMPWTLSYALDAPAERDLPPPAAEDDRDGFAQAFPDGLPWGEEALALHLLVGLARRLRGAVRVSTPPDAAAAGAPVRLIQPDPDRAVDLVIHSPTWLDPHVVHGVVGHVVPGAELAVDAQEWNGPSPQAYSGGLVGDVLEPDPLTPFELDSLHAAADRFDMAALSREDTIDAYAVVAELATGATLGADGAIEVLVHVSDPGEPSVAGLDWGSHPFASYEIRWACAEPEERECRTPGESYLASRERVRPLVAAVARSLVEVTGGVITDEDGFPVDRYRL
jgi:hypothetical protein